MLWSTERVRILQEALRRLTAWGICRALPADPRRLGVHALTCATSLVLGWCASWWLVPLYLGLMFWLLGGTNSTPGEAVPAARRQRGETAPNPAVGEIEPLPAVEASASRKTRRAEPGSKQRKRRARAAQPAGSPAPQPVEIRFVKVGPGQFVRVEEPVARAEDGEPSSWSPEFAPVDDSDPDRVEDATESKSRGQVENHDDSPTTSTSAVAGPGISPSGGPSKSRQNLAGLPARAALAASDDLECEREFRVAEPHFGGTQDDLPRDQEANQTQEREWAAADAKSAAGPPASQCLMGPLAASESSGDNGACARPGDTLAPTACARQTIPKRSQSRHAPGSFRRDRNRGPASKRGRPGRACYQRGSSPRAFQRRQSPARRG